MSSRPLRFVQAGDFQLHQPIAGLADVPDHLTERLLEAPYRAAAKVFDAAIDAEADFVLLVGNLCDPRRAGPRGLVFLREQFARLAQRGIAIYWATAPADVRVDWPAQLEWPSNVHVFAANPVEHLTHHREGTPVCQIAGRSFDASSDASPPSVSAYSPSADGLFSIAMIPGPLPFEPGDLPPIGNNYWAVGGSSPQPTTIGECETPCVVRCAGAPQGRTPLEIGPHGCTLVEIDEAANVLREDQIRLTPIYTDVVRWHEELVVWPALAAAEAANLECELHERMNRQIAAAAGRMLLVRWKIESVEPLADPLDQPRLAAELLARLRTEYGFREPPAWSVSLAIAPAPLPASWSEQQTLLGEFLRRLKNCESADGEELSLDGYLPQAQLDEPLAKRIRRIDPAARQVVLRKAAMLGAELLSAGAARREPAVRGHSQRSNGAALR